MDKEDQEQISWLREKTDAIRHESILRDEALRETQRDLMRHISESTTGIITLTSRLVRLIEAQAKTDARWNELIDMLGREHGNGHSKE